MRPLALLILALAAAPAAAQDAMPAAEEGRAIFMDHRAACHGADARGGGPMAPLLSVPPAPRSGTTTAPSPASG